VYNGEIYNYIELRQEMESAGAVFRTQSDTEVLLELYARKGRQALQSLNGMFAFAIWDRVEGSIFMARDRLGIKPLYYSMVQGELVFASELKSLLCYPGISREIDRFSVSKYFTYSYIPAPHTIFKGVSKMQPGTCMSFDGRGEPQPELYWDIPLSDNPIATATADEYAEQFLQIMRDSVKKRLRSDVPVGVFLSGGIDSSTIVALAAQEAGRQIHTFSVGFEESTYDESPFAMEVARRWHTEHHHEVLSARRALDLLPEVMDILDEPFGDASMLPTYLLSRFTAQSVKVVLGGDGGDELFAGYPSFQAHKVMETLSFLPMGWRDFLNRLVRRIPVSHKYASVEFLLDQFMKGAGISPEIRFFIWMGCYGNEQKRRLLSEEVRQELLYVNAFEDILNYVRQSGLIMDFERLQYLCMKLYMQDDILVKVDRASMANSLEVRVPFLDHHVVEFTSGINPRYKLHGLKAKYLLKRAARNLIPASVIKRRKAGFMIPLAVWLTHDLRDLVEDMCSESAIKKDGLFDYRFVRSMLDDHFNRRRDYRKMIWTLLAFQIWRSKYGPS
jgi:asparagine synthase (glutamine-hydrolysing)